MPRRILRRPRNFRIRHDVDDSLPAACEKYGLTITALIDACLLFALAHPDFKGHDHLIVRKEGKK